MQNGQLKNKELIAAMNTALNQEISTAVRYLLQGASIEGRENEPLRAMYRSEIGDEIGHAQYLADKIVALGGTPKINPDLRTPPAEIAEMVEQDVAAEEKDVQAYKRLAKLAEKAGEIELKLRMEEQAADESRHAENLRRMVA